MDPESAPHGPVDITDILALVVLVLASMRRLNVKIAEAADYPHVSERAFLQWKERALAAYGLVVQASFLKVVLNTIWYYGARTLVPPPALAIGGALLFVGWVIALTMAWRRATAARIRQAELGIVLRGRTDQPAGPR